MLTGLSLAANRSLEDLDEYYRSNPSLIVTRDKDAISAKRPQKYIDRENEEIARNAAPDGVVRLTAKGMSKLADGTMEHKE